MGKHHKKHKSKVTKVTGKINGRPVKVIRIENPASGKPRKVERWYDDGHYIRYIMPGGVCI
ncbi:hypothetical protein H6504_00475 [Candidatus Woesearchaeota archaeon]|nr:hypothetical protein [Candidatus Woesearchaeota archaeon]